MRLHRLRFGAIGPFPGEHTIDFDRLATSGLFMLEGPTGSGKSTVIDAIVYALYGQVAGAESVSTRMRSDFAAPETPSYVELTFETDAGVYQVRRTPEYDRPKKRGTGTTREKATALLSRVAGPDDVLVMDGVRGMAEVSAEVQHLIGLTREQFTQVVVLPQGQFAQFLQAGTDDRARLLQRVFGTEVFERVQRVLAEQAKDARAARETAVGHVLETVQRFAEAAGSQQDVVTAIETAVRGADEDTLRSLRRVEESRLADALAAVALADHEAQQRSAEATAALQAQLRLAESLQRRQQLLAERSLLAQQDQEVAALAQRVELAHRASAVVPLSQRWQQAEARAAAAHQAWQDALAGADGAHDDVAALARDHHACPETVTLLRDLAREAGEERASLTDLAATEEALPAARAAYEADVAALPDSQRELEATAEGILAAREAIGALRQEMEEVARVADRHAEATLDLSNAKVDRDRVKEHAAAVAEVERLKIAFVEATQVSDAAEQAHWGVRADWIAGQAARLALELKEGQACPVCGADEHPRLADHAALVSDEALDRSRHKQETAHRAMLKAHERVVQAEGRRDQLSLGLPTDVERHVQEATERVAQTKAAQSRGKELARQIETETAQVEARTKALTAQEQTLATRRAVLQRTQVELAEKEKAVVSARGDSASVAERRRRAGERSTTARRLADAVATLDSAQEQEREASQAMAAWLAEQRFQTEAEAREAVMAPADLSEADERVTQHRADSLRVKHALAQEPLSSLTGSESPDIDGAREADRVAAQERDTAHVAHEQAARALRSARTHADSICAGVSGVLALDAESGPLVRMAELAVGDGANTARQQLSTFVLVQRFQDVLDAANVRLAAMTSGRYQMQRSLSKEKGSREQRTGLGIEIVDHETERRRSPRSLSGGETFQFSLCLALGLADVVTQENGGIHMGTLFVDEGFGTLDADVLEVVMRELNGLHQEGHRAVGVVSHVAEMKNQIAERVEVRRTARGSTLSVIA